MYYAKAGLLVVGDIFILPRGLAFIRYIFLDDIEDAIQNGAKLQGEAANLSLQGTKSMTNLAQELGNLSTTVANLSHETGTQIVNLIECTNDLCSRVDKLERFMEIVNEIVRKKISLPKND